jgi:uncharacterized membrane protein YciS (DUF1049 family)
VRNALILLAVVALFILAVGALNNGTAFDIDYAAGTASSVSLFWVSAVLAALVFVVGLAAAWFAQAAVAGRRRKLEAELQSTYERLREAEALAARPAPVVVETAPVEVATAAAEQPPVSGPQDATVVAAEDVTIVAEEDVTTVTGEDATIVTGEDETVVVEDAITTVSREPAGAEEPEASVEAGEQTAVTMMSAAAEAEEVAPAEAGGEEAAPAGAAGGEEAAPEKPDDGSGPSGI